jgi:hypothetical protein
MKEQLKDFANLKFLLLLVVITQHVIPLVVAGAGAK